MRGTLRTLVPARLLVALALASALASGCSSASPKPGGTATLASGSAGSTTTTTTTTSTTSGQGATTTTTDPWAVPATITPAYVDRVLAELNHIDGNAFRSARQADSVTPTFLQLEAAIRAGAHELQFQVKLAQQQVAQSFRGIRAVPGDRLMIATSLLPAPPMCVLASVNVSFGSITIGAPIKYPPWYVALVSSPSTATNPTHWRLADDGFEPGGGAPTPSFACAAS